MISMWRLLAPHELWSRDQKNNGHRRSLQSKTWAWCWAAFGHGCVLPNWQIFPKTLLVFLAVVWKHCSSSQSPPASSSVLRQMHTCNSKDCFEKFECGKDLPFFFWIQRSYHVVWGDCHDVVVVLTSGHLENIKIMNDPNKINYTKTMPMKTENDAKKSFIVDGKHLVDDDVVPIQWHLGGRDCQKMRYWKRLIGS